MLEFRVRRCRKEVEREVPKTLTDNADAHRHRQLVNNRWLDEQLEELGYGGHIRGILAQQSIPGKAATLPAFPPQMLL